MKVIEINDYNTFLSLKEKWTETLQRCDHTIFSTWEWLSIWWKHFGNNKKLILLLAEENEKIVGIAPLMYSVYTLFGLRRGKIEFIGTSTSDYNDFILGERGRECLQLFIAYLNTYSWKWDSIDLVDIPGRSKTLHYINEISIVKPLHQCFSTQLPISFEIFLSTLKRKHRKELSRTSRRLNENFNVEFINYSKNTGLRKEMGVFFDLHQKRWQPRGFSGVFDDQRNRNFHLDIAKSFSKKGWLGLFSLSLSGTPAAALYGFKYNSKYYAYLSGVNPKFLRYGVGSLLFSAAIDSCINEGMFVFDFMRGAEEYKGRWNTTMQENYQAVLTKKGVIVKAHHWLYNAYWKQGNRLRYLLRMR
ncbi:MAG: GNAT family N-acetyltransferase [Promethearchaeota archaeon]